MHLRIISQRFGLKLETNEWADLFPLFWEELEVLNLVKLFLPFE